jgi:hypothetical protein
LRAAGCHLAHRQHLALLSAGEAYDCGGRIVTTGRVAGGLGEPSRSFSPSCQRRRGALGSGDWSRQASSPGAKGGGPEGCRAKPFLLMGSDEFRSLNAVLALGAPRFGTPSLGGPNRLSRGLQPGTQRFPLFRSDRGERSPKGMDKFAVGFNLRSSKKGGRPIP